MPRKSLCLYFKIITPSALFLYFVVVYIFPSEPGSLESGSSISEDHSLISSHKTLDPQQLGKTNAAKPSKGRELILFESQWWHPNYPFLAETKRMCPKCRFTENSALFERSSAVIFHGVTLSLLPPVSRRRKGQIWVWLIFETPSYVGSSVTRASAYADMFNWTMTYRHDSDVQVPYGRFVPFTEVPLPGYDEKWAFMPSALPNKENEIYDKSFMETPTIEELKDRRMVAWIVSHCPSGSKREVLAKELSKYVPVDIYGQCGNYSCQVPRAKGMSGIDCRFQISKQYKFYLAFENTLCEDYVTEKYFDALFTQMVPIVYGGANYSRFAPKKSFIDVADFGSMETLALYLKYLHSNPEEYLKYFDWRKSYWVQNNRFVSGYCALCDKLWNHDKTVSKVYHNLTEWWYHRSDYSVSGQQACSNPTF